MEEQEYEKMAAVEDRMWWYRALHGNLLRLLRRHLAPAPAAAPRRVLDAGCGTGGFLRFLAAEEPEIQSTGIDVVDRACELAARRSGRPVCRASINALPFEAGRLDAVVSADVLEHYGVDVEASCREVFRCLRPGGVFVLSVTANEWLRSYHDERVGVARRFSRPEMRRILQGAGFSVAYLGHWNTLLFPLVVLRRKVFPPGSGESDVKDYGRFGDTVLGSVMSLERMALARGWQLPFGVSILAVGIRES